MSGPTAMVLRARGSAIAEQRPLTGRLLSIVDRLRRVADDDPDRPDLALVQRFQAGDRRAFEEIYRRHYDRVQRVAMRMVGDRTLAEDITQEVFVRAYRALPDFQTRAKLSTWLYRVTFNACADHLKSGRNRFERQAAEGLLERQESQAPSPVESIEAEQRREMVATAVQRLPEKYRMVVILRDIEERPYAEMAEVLDLPITTMKMRAIRGREMLARLIERMGDP